VHEQRATRYITGHKSFQAITCTGTHNQNKKKHYIRPPKHKRDTEKTALASKRNYSLVFGMLLWPPAMAARKRSRPAPSLVLTPPHFAKIVVYRGAALCPLTSSHFHIGQCWDSRVWLRWATVRGISDYLL